MYENFIFSSFHSSHTQDNLYRRVKGIVEKLYTALGRINEKTANRSVPCRLDSDMAQ